MSDPGSIPSPPSPPRPPSAPSAATTAPRPPSSLPAALALPLKEVLDADGSALMLLDLAGRPRLINRAGLELLNAATIDEVAPGTPAHAVLRSLLDHVPRRLLLDANGGRWHGDFDHTNPAGQHQLFRATVVVHRVEGLFDGGFVGVTAHDVTVAREENARLRHRANHDPLTGLANRRQIITHLASAISNHRGRSGHVAAIFIDVDRLKYVNDALGHAVGDRLLVSTAERLRDAVRPSDSVARIGGDEFLVVCSAIPDAAVALDLAERIRRALSGRLHVHQLDLKFSVSIGLALSEHDIVSMPDDAAASALISNADTAMYEAKNSGRGRCVLFSSQMRSAARERTELAAALALAVNERRLDVQYQPVFSAITQKAIGAEALVRWNHPQLGRIDPATFVSIAEESGSIGRLGEFVLEQSMTDARLWIEQGLVDERFAVHVNVSLIQLASSSFVNLIMQMLRHHRLQPEQLVLEAREASLLGRNVDVERSIRALRRSGVQIAIDNFGTGAKALSVLTDVGADVLKLDGSLALPSGSSDADTRLVRAIVLLAHALEMRVIAERVSGIEQLRRLRAAGCDYVQGNLLAEPGPADGLTVTTSY